MIAANVYDSGKAEICRVWLRGCPHAGDILWLGPSTSSGQAPGTSVRIARVEHVCDSAWRPNINLGEPPHSLIIHVEPR